PAGKTAPKKKPGNGTLDAPWQLTTPPGSSEFTAFRDNTAGALVVRVGKTELRYRLRCIEDLHAMLTAHGDWMPLGGADEQKPAPDGTGAYRGPGGRHPARGLVWDEESAG